MNPRLHEGVENGCVAGEKRLLSISSLAWLLVFGGNEALVAAACIAPIRCCPATSAKLSKHFSQHHGVSSLML